MVTSSQSGQRGLRGLYRFTDAEEEARFQARFVQWCYWPVVIELGSSVALDVVSLVSYVGVNPFAVPWYTYWMAGMDGVALLVLGAIHGSRAARRCIVPLFCGFLWLQAIRHATFIHLQTDTWTQNSYTIIVPASYRLYLEGPGGRADVGAVLEGHFSLLAAYRASQAAFISVLAPSVYTMLLGLNVWSIVTLLWLPTAFIIGLAATPQIATVSILLLSVSTSIVPAFTLLFAGALERMQRRYFQAEQRLQWELQASQMADSILNHSLKNTLADVAGNIEMFLAEALPPKVLEDSIVTLRRGMRNCKERQAYLKLVSGQYQPVLNAIPLWEFGRQLLAGRHAAGQFPDCTIYADHMLLTIVFDNALSNAAKHGDQQNPDVRFTIEEIPAEVCRGLPDGKRRFCFQVTNVAQPGRPELTPQCVEQLFAGRAEGSQQPHSVVPVLSDRIGLSHCAMAAGLGGISLSLTQEDDLVIFSGTIDAEVQVTPMMRRQSLTEAPIGADAPAFAGLAFVILDDSPAALRLLKFHIEKWCRPASVTCLGASAADVAAFLAKALLVDVVIVDQQLEWEDGGVLGSNLVRQLRRLGFKGFICIRSADDGPADQAIYQRAGADCSLGKDLLGPVMVRLLQDAYADFAHRQPQQPSALQNSAMRNGDCAVRGAATLPSALPPWKPTQPGLSSSSSSTTPVDPSHVPFPRHVIVSDSTQGSLFDSP